MKRCIVVVLFLLGCGTTIDVSRDGSVSLMDARLPDANQIPTDSQVTDGATVQVDAQVRIVNCFTTAEISGPNAKISTTLSCDGRNFDVELFILVFSVDDVLIDRIPRLVNCTSKASISLSEISFVKRIEVTYIVHQINESGTCKH